MEASSPISFSVVEFVALIGAGAFVLFMLTRSRRFVGAAVFALFMVLMVSGLFFRMVRVGGEPSWPSVRITRSGEWSISHERTGAKTTTQVWGPATRRASRAPKAASETSAVRAAASTFAGRDDGAIEAPATKEEAAKQSDGQPSVGNLTVPPSGAESQANGPTPPEWVKRSDVVENGTHIHVVNSGPHVSLAEAMNELRRRAIAYTEDYIEQVLKPSPQGRLDVYPAFVERAVLKETWQTTTQRTPAGEPEDMVVVYGRLEFDQPTKGYLQQRWESTLATQQLFQIGLVVALVLTLVGTLYAYFRLDTVTKGYYTWRLRLAAFGIAVAACVCAAGLGDGLVPSLGWMTVGAESGPSNWDEHLH
jgi:hypothetical protein